MPVALVQTRMTCPYLKLNQVVYHFNIHELS